MLFIGDVTLHEQLNIEQILHVDILKYISGFH